LGVDRGSKDCDVWSSRVDRGVLREQSRFGYHCGVTDNLDDRGLAAATTAAPTTAAPTTAAPTTAAPTTAVATTAVATTVPAAPLYPISYDGLGLPTFPVVLGSPGDPNGSGCSPPGYVLPDGIWFGYAEAVAAGVITFDLACYFTGTAAETGSAAGNCDNEFGYCIRNQNPKVFSVLIGPTADVFYIDDVTWDLAPVAPTAWPVTPSYLTCPGERCGVWLYVNGGVATGVVEMFEE